MIGGVAVRHTVSLAGVVRNNLGSVEPVAAAPDEQFNREVKRRIGGALIEIIIDEAPQVFQTMVKTKQADPLWAQQRQRVDRTWSHSDGVFYFVDLPSGEFGEGYRLRVTLPAMGTRYGTVETAPVAVPERPEGRPLPPVQVDVELPSTRIVGTVTDAAAIPIARATARLRGDAKIVRTDADGRFELNRLLAGKPTLEIVTPDAHAFAQKVELTAGQTLTVNLQFNPNDGSWRWSVG